MSTIKHDRLHQLLTDLKLTFIAAWCEEPGIRTKYSGLVFDRNCRDRDAAQKVLGVGNKLMDLAIKQARNSAASVTLVSKKILRSPLVVLRIRDRVTSVAGAVRAVVVGCLIFEDNTFQILRDWELLQYLNVIQSDRNFRRSIGANVVLDRSLAQQKFDRARNAVESRFGNLELPFTVPEVSILALLWPDEFPRPESTNGAPESDKAKFDCSSGR